MTGFFFHINWEFHHPNWRNHILQRGWNHQPTLDLTTRESIHKWDSSDWTGMVSWSQLVVKPSNGQEWDFSIQDDGLFGHIEQKNNGWWLKLVKKHQSWDSSSTPRCSCRKKYCGLLDIWYTHSGSQWIILGYNRISWDTVGCVINNIPINQESTINSNFRHPTILSVCWISTV